MNPKHHNNSPEVQANAQSSQRHPAYRLSLGAGIRAMRTDRAFLWLIALFIALNVADLVLTLIGLHLGASEANPLFNPILRQSAVTASLLKFAGTLLLTTILLTTFSTMPRATRWVAATLNLILIVFVANNAWTVVRLLAR
jgi:hypothetical protein